MDVSSGKNAQRSYFKRIILPALLFASALLIIALLTKFSYKCFPCSLYIPERKGKVDYILISFLGS